MACAVWSECRCLELKLNLGAWTVGATVPVHLIITLVTGVVETGTCLVGVLIHAGALGVQQLWARKCSLAGSCGCILSPLVNQVGGGVVMW